MSKRISQEKEKEIIDFYKSKPMTYEEVSNKFGYSLPTIGKIIKKYRIKPYSKVRLFSPNLIENYFETIDNEYKAYFLGLIITDGCIYSKNNRQNLVTLTLQNQDKYIINEFINAIHSNKNITSDNRGCSSVQILSNKMVADLKKYQITDNKSLNTVFPTNIPKEFYPHLIRGILDGDGSISFYSRPNRKAHTKAIRFCQGNKQFLNDLVTYLEKNVYIKPVNIYQEKESLWSIAYRNNESLYKLYHYLYNDATIYIKRKKDLCDKIINEIVYYHGNTEITNYCNK
jgi:hypothetical protein